MMAKWAPLEDARVLVAGCGVGMYAGQIRERYSERVEAFDIEISRRQARSARHPWRFGSRGRGRPPSPIPPLMSPCRMKSSSTFAMIAGPWRSCCAVVKPGGRVLLFCPNRWHPFETHGPLLEGRVSLRQYPTDQLLAQSLARPAGAPRPRLHSAAELRRLLAVDCAEILHHSRVYGGYDNIIARLGAPAIVARDLLYRLEGGPLDTWGAVAFLSSFRSASYSPRRKGSRRRSQRRRMLPRVRYQAFSAESAKASFSPGV